MQLSDLDYPLPPELIAQHPIEPRDSARLLVDRGPGVAPDHRHVRDLVDLLGDGDLLVVNDSKVIPARLALRRSSGGAVEVLLLEPLDAGRRRWEALVRPGGKLRAGEVLVAGDRELVRFEGRAAAGDTFEVTILGDDDPLASLAEHGRMPLPPYITAPLGEPDRYQTVYAAEPGSAAAPTAGLHLTTELLGRLGARGVELATVELVVGLDTFQPISVDDPLTHRIHSERFRVPDGVLARCAAARRVVAVGTTAVRALESAATFGVGEGRTELFIHPGYDWKVVDVLMTNFHLPRTTLLLMIEAFVGARWRDLYAAAIAERYRFLSFGDAMLLEREAS
jgi:S-adenosylmethionine:tRNA ribosyltransferase-isomerase